MTNPAERPVVATISARRITGGAIVTVTRGDHVRRYRVGLRRYNRLADILTCHLGTWGGVFTTQKIETVLISVEGLTEARRWAQRYGFPRAKHWRRA